MNTKFKIKVGKSKIDGRGAFADALIPTKRKIGELEGELISVRKARQIAKQNKRIAIVEFDNKLALHANDNNNSLRYVNHSCAPNTYMRIFGYHVEFYSLKRIKLGEELTCNYGETHHDGKLKCRCGAVGCVGAL